MTNRKIEYWVIPPTADAEFVASMEDVLEVYEQPYDARCPVVCMDEQPVQLLKETRKPIPATANHAKRVDYEYERAGTANIFMFTEPLELKKNGNRASRVGPVAVMNDGVVLPGATPLLTNWNCGLTAGPVPPIAGCAWHELQLFELNRGPRPTLAVPETVSTAWKRVRPS